MDIMICTHDKDASSVLEGVKAYFSQAFPAEQFAWEESGTILTGSLSVREKEITGVYE